jgi:hypothetical protein
MADTEFRDDREPAVRHRISPAVYRHHAVEAHRLRRCAMAQVGASLRGAVTRWCRRAVRRGSRNLDTRLASGSAR